MCFIEFLGRHLPFVQGMMNGWMDGWKKTNQQCCQWEVDKNASSSIANSRMYYYLFFFPFSIFFKNYHQRR
ncbi:hypothetical protein I7I53_05076 [Histoplasma capsulatum var. duboisii H88]|uniref:Uncharacterized protein n=1 Tax=Ajellomyces capsulatus (strain H88) TaxID=544711 RepID=A0A8A1LX91_AJEC8|nr:hypothetical protein I7I53_05076 [Histoplasma capsulatum var. duboisii H88]